MTNQPNNVQPTKGIVTSEHPEWYNPKVNPPPRGVDMLCLQSSGTLVKSNWMDGIGFIAWYPLPSLPEWAKDLRRHAYFKNVDTSGLNLDALKDNTLYDRTDAVAGSQPG